MKRRRSYGSLYSSSCADALTRVPSRARVASKRNAATGSCVVESCWFRYCRCFNITSPTHASLQGNPSDCELESAAVHLLRPPDWRLEGAHTRQEGYTLSHECTWRVWCIIASALPQAPRMDPLPHLPGLACPRHGPYTRHLSPACRPPSPPPAMILDYLWTTCP